MYIKYAGLMLAVLGMCCSGCTVAYDAVRTNVLEPAHYGAYRDYVYLKAHTCKAGEEAWKLARAEVPGYSKAYHAGFVAGYADFLQFGGNGEPPPLPPRSYWAKDTLPQRQAALDWFSGFRHGATVAMKSGIRELIVVPASAGLPAQDAGSDTAIPGATTPEAAIPDGAVPLPAPREFGPNDLPQLPETPLADRFGPGKTNR